MCTTTDKRGAQETLGICRAVLPGQPEVGLLAGFCRRNSLGERRAGRNGRPGIDRRARQQRREARRATLAAGEAIETAGWLDDPTAFHPAPPPIEDWDETTHRGFQLARTVSYRTLQV